jgi:SH3-like domain-containing protein
LIHRGVLFLCLAILPTLWAGALAAQDAAGPTASRLAERPGRTGLPLPRFVTLRAAEVNLRLGPGVRYPIDWVYRRRGLPVEVIDEFETWRRIRDHEGTTGWVHQSMLAGRRNVVVTGETSLLRHAPEADAPGVASLQVGVIARLEGCEGDWCRVAVERYGGWLRRGEVFGLYPGETVP